MVILHGKKLFLFLFLTIFSKSPLLSIGEYFLGQKIPYPVSETNRLVFNIESDPVFASRLIFINWTLYLRLFSNETLTFNDSEPLKYVITSSADPKSNDLKLFILGLGIKDRTKLNLNFPLVIQYNTDPFLPAELWSNGVKLGFAYVYNNKDMPFPVWMKQNLDAVDKISLENSIQAAIAKKVSDSNYAAAVAAANVKVAAAAEDANAKVAAAAEDANAKVAAAAEDANAKVAAATADANAKVAAATAAANANAAAAAEDANVKVAAAEKLKQEEIIRAQDKANASTKKILIGTSVGLGVVAAGGIGYGLWRRRPKKLKAAKDQQPQTSRPYQQALRQNSRYSR